MLPCLDDSSHAFPPTSSALAEPNGLLAFGGNLQPQRLLQAYCRGIFPWYEAGQPVLWWSPDPRMVLLPEKLHVARSLRKQIWKLLHQPVRIAVNEDFPAVIAACAMKRPYADGTWITPQMQQAFCKLHALGYGMSVEVRDENNALIGGLYGLALGQVFFGESMFSMQSGTSKLAFVYLVRLLQHWKYRLIDCQVSSEHLAGFGAQEISRKSFEAYLPTAANIPAPDPRWQHPKDYRELLA